MEEGGIMIEQIPIQTHPCNQEVTLNTICIKISNIETAVERMEAMQTQYVNDMARHALYTARYPTPEEAKESQNKIERHETYFKIFGTAVVASWGLLLFLLDKWVTLGKP
jgi:hypothetical protein